MDLEKHEYIPPSDASDLDPPPDGGIIAWSQVLAGHLIK